MAFRFEKSRGKFWEIPWGALAEMAKESGGWSKT
jgi:hypothetical protein